MHTDILFKTTEKSIQTLILKTNQCVSLVPFSMKEMNMEILCPEEYHRLKVNFGSPELKSFKITAHKQLEINIYTEVKVTVTCP